MLNNKLKSGEEVTIYIPFTYIIGDEGVDEKEIETLQDCIDTLKSELENGALDGEITVEIDGTSFDI